MNSLQKRIVQLQSDVEQAKVQLDEATDKLENTNKQLSNVNHRPFYILPNHLSYIRHIRFAFFRINFGCCGGAVEAPSLSDTLGFIVLIEVVDVGSVLYVHASSHI